MLKVDLFFADEKCKSLNLINLNLLLIKCSKTIKVRLEPWVKPKQIILRKILRVFFGLRDEGMSQNKKIFEEQSQKLKKSLRYLVIECICFRNSQL